MLSRGGPCRVVIGVVAVVVSLGLLSEAAIAGEPVTGGGPGSPALEQWRSDVARQGVPVTYLPFGATVARRFYIDGQIDFAVSETPFLAVERPGAAHRPYAYVAIYAGGLSFPYNLTVQGNRITDLRLSGSTIARIFTGRIRNWNHPAITADDGRRFPSIPIKPIVRTDASGTSTQLTSFLAAQYPRLWRDFCRRVELSPCAATSLYPYFDGTQGQAGSDGVASGVAAPWNQGAITYVEYAFAKQRGLPVVAVRNRAGAFVPPEAGNVTVALRRARLKRDGTHDLDRVAGSPDPQAYPLSSYTYLIVPTTTDPPFTVAKGRSLGRFLTYSLCAGQAKLAGLGYSSLPSDLVGRGLHALGRIPGAPPPPRLRACRERR